MPDNMMPGMSPPSPGGGMGPGAGSPDVSRASGPMPQQGASGPGGATMPAGNAGALQAVVARVAVYVQGLQQVLAVVPFGSPFAKDLRRAIDLIAKYAPQGSASRGVQMSEAQKMLMQQRQNIGQQQPGIMPGGGGMPQPGPGGMMR